jgi:predicted Rossmann fold nucleotide-binding protein DprA/Smf involved in DNA uptake
VVKAAITGHRKILDKQWLYDAFVQAFRETGTTYVFQGMAEGADQIAALAAIDEEIPYACVRPWNKHSPHGDKNQIQMILDLAESIVTIVPVDKYPGIQSFIKRNRYMVDNADILIASWDGRPNGGTWQTLYYATRNNKRIYRINPANKTCGWFDRGVRYEDETFI